MQGLAEKIDPKSKTFSIWPGDPYPLGATWDGKGVNFALFSENATKVELCLFDSPESKQESHRIPLTERTHFVWHIYLPELRPGTLYGYRVHGPYEPENGHRFNPNKIVLDPYAKAIGRQLVWSDEMFGYTVGNEKADLLMDTRDNAAWAPLAAVIDSLFDWGADKKPKVPWNKTLIYEAHVKGFTKLHPEVPEIEQGTYQGMVSKAALNHFKKLGITAVELMPVDHFLHDRHLIDRKLSNYWGYNTLSFFAPHPTYAANKNPQEAINEFKNMVKALHSEGLEVILDVVYNHTAEGNQMGPTLSLRGVDNVSYYRLSKENARYYEDFTGCGNSLNMQNPATLQLVMDSLRYWVLEMHVDGFRFDLASTLARELFEVDKLSAFFDIIHQDPVLSQVKLIAEPWDVGAGGYQVGNFPPGWTEWNGKYRDVIRKFWKGDGGMVNEFAQRICGSSDLYGEGGRLPHASINFITSHDGFSMHDLVSYNEKHNEANGENSQDGDNNNESWNCGAEGETSDAEIHALREKQKRNLIATLLLSQGVPMIRSGDEIGHTQKGNNNAYCQDNEISWLDWNLNERKQNLLNFTASAIGIWQKQPVLKRRKFFKGRQIRGSQIKDVAWFETSGKEMSDESWNAGFVRCLGVLLAGDALDEVDSQGKKVVGDTLFLLMNAHHEDLPFKLPIVPEHFEWECILNTAEPDKVGGKFKAQEELSLSARSMLWLRKIENH